MRVDADDRRWLRQSHRYAMNDAAGMPESGRFHGGQKMLFWAQSLAAVALLTSGLVMWFPGTAPRGLTFAALLIHPLAAIVAIGGIIVHIYMAVAAIPGSLRAMTRGWVSADWAALASRQVVRQDLRALSALPTSKAACRRHRVTFR